MTGPFPAFMYPGVRISKQITQLFKLFKTHREYLVNSIEFSYNSRQKKALFFLQPPRYLARSEILTLDPLQAYVCPWASSGEMT